MSAADRERWDERYRAAGTDRRDAPAVLELASPWLPPGGTGLDIACGPGGGALWLAERGLSVDAVDISPVALAILAASAAPRGLAGRVRSFEADLDDDLPTELTGPYEVLLCLRFRYPRLSEVATERLAPGGLVAASVLSMVGRRSGSGGGESPDSRFLAAPGELADRFAAFEVLHHEEGGGEAAIIARKPAMLG